MKADADSRKWKEIIGPGTSLLTLNVREIWNYRDLLFILTRRDLIATYKQTILGPVWFVLQPVLTTITFVIIFSRIANLSTSGLPPVLFYLSGIVMWSYFAECINRTSAFFKDSGQILSKVYFPRLIIPLSLVVTNLVKFGIQMLLFFAIYAWFAFSTDAVHPNAGALLFPVLVMLIAGLGLGLGMMISALTIKYKDFMHFLAFGVQLLMYASPVIFPLSGVTNPGYRILLKANPMTGIIEAFRYGFLGAGELDWGLLAYDFGCVMLFLLLGLMVFNSVEKNFVDSI